MATKPTQLIPWDSGGTNLVAVTSTHQTAGFANGETPTSGEQNTWQQNVWLWLAYVVANIATIVHNTFPKILLLGGWSYQVGGGGAAPAYISSTNTTLIGDLDIPVGYKLSTLTFGLVAQATNSGTLVITLVQNTTTINPVNFQAKTFSSGSLPTTLTDQTLNLLASSTGLTVTVAAAGGTYTRSAGSFITDGFFVGQQVQWGGFFNSGNNAQKTITALTATVMTVSTTGLVNETGSAGAQSVTGVSPTVDSTFGWAIRYDMSSALGGSNISVGILRYTCVPQ